VQSLLSPDVIPPVSFRNPSLPRGHAPLLDHISRGRSIKYRRNRISEKKYSQMCHLTNVSGYSCSLRRSTAGLVPASRWPAAPLRCFDLGQPRRRSASPAATSPGQTLQAQDCFFDLLTFLAQVRQHSVYIHGVSKLLIGPTPGGSCVLIMEQFREHCDRMNHFYSRRPRNSTHYYSTFGTKYRTYRY